jgi:hypothetical protein
MGFFDLREDFYQLVGLYQESDNNPTEDNSVSVLE